MQLGQQQGGSEADGGLAPQRSGLLRTSPSGSAGEGPLQRVKQILASLDRLRGLLYRWGGAGALCFYTPITSLGFMTRVVGLWELLRSKREVGKNPRTSLCAAASPRRSGS